MAMEPAVASTCVVVKSVDQSRPIPAWSPSRKPARPGRPSHRSDTSGSTATEGLITDLEEISEGAVPTAATASAPNWSRSTSSAIAPSQARRGNPVVGRNNTAAVPVPEAPMERRQWMGTLSA